MGDGNELVLSNTTEVKDYKVNKEILIESAKSIGFDIAAERLSTEAGNVYVDNVQQVLGDPNFGLFFRAYKKMHDFRNEHSEEVARYDKTLEGLDWQEMAQKAKELLQEPTYVEYLEIDKAKGTAQIPLLDLPTTISGPIHDLAAEYAKRSNIIFPEDNVPVTRSL